MDLEKLHEFVYTKKQTFEALNSRLGELESAKKKLEQQIQSLSDELRVIDAKVSGAIESYQEITETRLNKEEINKLLNETPQNINDEPIQLEDEPSDLDD